jgi:chromosome segregation ATPase
MEEKQKINLNAQIEKYKNEAYSYRCEKEELKMQLNNFKARKDVNEKEMQKLKDKCEKYKEKVTELEKVISRNETERKEFENKFYKEMYEVC